MYSIYVLLQHGIDSTLRKEQAGFRRNRSTVDQIFILWNILEQANEWNATMYIHFIDFEKAFDSIHRESLWHIMREYGIPVKIVEMVKAMYEGFECAVIEDGDKTEWFFVKSGVKQGCVMSGFLFLLVIDWTMRRVTDGKRTGIRWSFTSVLEDLDFADDIALLASKFEHIQSKTELLVEEAGRVGLKLNCKKCKSMRINSRRDTRIKVGHEEVESVQDFVYLGATLFADGGGDIDICNRTAKARGTFLRLGRLWSTASIGRKTKMKLYKTLVLPVLLYGCETSKVTKSDEKKLDGFQFNCLRKIVKNRWQQMVTNERIMEMSKIQRVSDEIRRRRWNWIGHVARRGMDDDRNVALGWKPEGHRRVGRPNMTWRRMIEKERDRAGWKSWTDVRRRERLIEVNGKLMSRPYAPHGVERIKVQLIYMVKKNDKKI